MRHCVSIFMLSLIVLGGCGQSAKEKYDAAVRELEQAQRGWITRGPRMMPRGRPRQTPCAARLPARRRRNRQVSPCRDWETC